MRPFLGSLFLLVNIFSASTGKSNVIIAGILLCICISFIYASKKKGDSILTSLVGLLCYTWSSSWRNVFGGSFADMPIPWFYIIGLIIFLYVLYNKKFKIKPGIFLLLGLLVTLGLFPLLISHNFSDAITDYITLLFFYIVIGAVQFTKLGIKEKEYFSILKSFVYATLISSIAIITQFIVQYFWGYNFIKDSQSALLGGRRMASSLMFGDLSSATICLGIGVIILMMDFKRFKHPYLITFCIVAGIALSSARTGFISLIITYLLYIIFGKNTVNKLKVMVASVLAGLIGTMGYYMVRGITNVGTLFNDNGRFDGYLAAIKIWMENPIFGIGFGDSYLSQLMQMPVPHFSLLKVLTQTGIIYLFCILALLLYYYHISRNVNYNYGKYMFIHAMVGACFIPGLFSARFLTIIIIIIILQKKIVYSIGLPDGNNP